MKDIRLLELVLENFRCHSYLRLDFGGGNASLSGDNGVGKTCVYDAFMWLLWGGASGVRPLGADGRPVPGKVTSAACTLLVDGRFLGLRRSCEPLPNGECACQYAVDGVACREQTYTRQVETLTDEETFRLLSDAGYFLRELPPQRRRELLCRGAGLPGDRELMEAQPEFAGIPAQMGEDSLDAYRRRLMIRVKEQTRVGNDLPGRIRECENTLRLVEGLDFAAAQGRLTELKEERQRLAADPAAGMERTRVESLRGRRDSLLRENRHYQEALEALEKERDALRKRVFRGEVCAECGQKLPPHRVSAAREAFRKKLRREAEALDSREARLRREALRAKEALEALEGELNEAEARLAGVPGEEPRHRLSEIGREMERLQRILDRQPLQAYAQRRLEALREQARQVDLLLEQDRKQLRLLERFDRFRAGCLEERVNALFENTRFRLFREKPGGGLEACCETYVAGVPWGDLGSGEKLRLGMELIRGLGEALGVRLPVFVDNAGGLTRLPEAGCQRIVLRTAPGPLKFVREEERVWEADPSSRSM